MVTLRFVLGVLVLATLGSATLPNRAVAATLMLAEQAAQVVSLRNVSDKDGEVTGEVVNNSKQALRDVQLQVLYSWRWKNEFHPGADDPGRAVYETIKAEIAPGQSTRFNYKPAPPLPARTDGHYDISVKVVGFTQLDR